MYCIYVAIGKRRGEVARIRETLEREGAMDYTTLVVASASDAAALQYMAPYSLAAPSASGSWKTARTRWSFMTIYPSTPTPIDKSRLLMRRPPGREAFPGDVFYLHSRLLERAAQLSDERGGGSLTALPVIETLARRRISLHSHQCHLHHRWPDLFGIGIVQRWLASRR